MFQKKEIQINRGIPRINGKVLRIKGESPRINGKTPRIRGTAEDRMALFTWKKIKNTDNWKRGNVPNKGNADKQENSADKWKSFADKRGKSADKWENSADKRLIFADKGNRGRWDSSLYLEKDKKY